MSDKSVTHEHLHDGHRARMRAKLAKYGERIFESYELLEMLLYTPIRYRDTNPVAKRLFKKYKTLDRIFTAAKDDLMSVEGVGEGTAGFIKSVDTASNMLDVRCGSYSPKVFDNYDVAGEYFVEHFREKKEKAVVMLLLDNRLRLIDDPYICNAEFGSAAIKSKDFVNKALQRHASVVMIAHNHPFGPLFPLQQDRATSRMLTDALGAAGVLVAETYLVCGDRFMSMTEHNKSKLFMQRYDVKSFFRRNGWAFPLASSHVASVDPVVQSTGTADHLAQLLLFTNKPEQARKTAESVLSKYCTLREAVCAPGDELVRSTGIRDADAVLLKIVAHLIARRAQERFVSGKAYSQQATQEYIRSLFVGKSVEQVYAIFYGDGDKYISTACVGEGTVNSINVTPRTLIELALANGAASLIIAHNHPSGSTEPSTEDIELTYALVQSFSDIGIALKAHYVVAADSCKKIEFDPIK